MSSSVGATKHVVALPKTRAGTEKPTTPYGAAATLGTQSRSCRAKHDSDIRIFRQYRRTRLRLRYYMEHGAMGRGFEFEFGFRCEKRGREINIQRRTGSLAVPVPRKKVREGVLEGEEDGRNGWDRGWGRWGGEEMNSDARDICTMWCAASRRWKCGVDGPVDRSIMRCIYARDQRSGRVYADGD